MIVVLISASFAFAEGEINVSSVITPKDTIAAHAFFDMAHMCTSGSENCKEPEKYTTGTPRMYVVFWAPAAQVYSRHYIITDMAGTLVAYENFSGSLTSGWNARFQDFSLPAGFYKFIAIFVGADGRTAISDPYTFRKL